ncbi:MAG: response regulator [Proteobacteria bacterium]|nr:response regulator [Pseudomonadota bacterium]
MRQKDVLTTFEAAKLCRVSYNTIKNWIKRGLLNAYRTAGGHLRINSEDIRIFCREHGIPMDDRAAPAPRKLLVVDDEEVIRTAIQDALRGFPEKIEVYTASDGFEAGTIMESVKPDIVILDLVMPGMDGFKVCQSIRRSPALSHVKIMVLTGFGSERNVDRAKELGADVCLSKPIDRAALFESVADMLKPRKGVRAVRPKKKRVRKG